MDDPIVKEVRQAREQLAKERHFDMHEIFANAAKKQEALGERLVQPGTAALRKAAAKHQAQRHERP